MKFSIGKLFLLIILFSNPVFSQSKDAVKIIVDKNFDIQSAAETYLGNRNLWTYILKANKLSGIEDLKNGMTITIPANKVKGSYAEISNAKKSIKDAIEMGAKILAEDLLNEAETYYTKSISEASNFDFESSISSAKKSILFSKRAYNQTKEIREKTVDAIVSYKKGTLQKRISSALSWIPAELYDNLREKDIARTLSQSNAQITFYDLSQIKLNENSQAVIQSSRYDPITKRSNSKVKLEKGDAYALLQNSPRKKFDVDIPGVKTKINSKYFWVEKGKSDTKLANYNGEIELEAKNQNIVVGKNQGSVIPDGGIPSQPIDLIQPPVLSSPPDLSLTNESNVSFGWIKNTSAKSYWLEIAKDLEFKSVISLVKNISDEQTKINLQEPGIYYWHVCSADEKGLPGNFSETFAFAAVGGSAKPFILLNDAKDIIFTNQSQYTISGKTLSGCNLTINGKSVDVASDGSFNAIINLNEGKNFFRVISEKTKSEISEVNRIIYYETINQLKLVNYSTGSDFTERKIITNSKFHKLNLRTIPFANVNLFNSLTESSIYAQADSTGYFSITYELENSSSSFELIITSQSGLSNKFHFDVTLDTQPPQIQLDEFNRNVSSPDFVFSGKSDAKLILINDEPVTLINNSAFRYETLLKQGINIFEFKAKDEAGNQTILKESIFFDKMPPALIDKKIIKAKGKNKTALIMIKAQDDSQLKKFASIVYSTNGKQEKDFARLNEDSGWYQLEVIDSQYLNIISVELEDYFSNKILYDLSK
jgi:hypothetical protein